MGRRSEEQACVREAHQRFPAEGVFSLGSAQFLRRSSPVSRAAWTLSLFAAISCMGGSSLA